MISATLKPFALQFVAGADGNEAKGSLTPAGVNTDAANEGHVIQIFVIPLLLLNAPKVLMLLL